METANVVLFCFFCPIRVYDNGDECLTENQHWIVGTRTYKHIKDNLAAGLNFQCTATFKKHTYSKKTENIFLARLKRTKKIKLMATTTLISHLTTLENHLTTSDILYDIWSYDTTTIQIKI